jgi:outer membrane protein assembly factor BamB
MKSFKSLRSRYRTSPPRKFVLMLSMMGIFYVILVMFVAAILYLMLFPVLSGSAYPTPVPLSPPKQITSSSLPLREIWRWSGLVASTPNDPPKIIIKDNMIILAIEEGGSSHDQKIIALDVETGIKIWETKATFDRPDSLTVDDERVYAAYLEDVRAFDLKTGRKLWTGAKQRWGKRGGLNVYVQDGQVEVYDLDVTYSSPMNSKLFFIDSQTGASLNTVEWGGIFFHRGNLYYSSPWLKGGFQNWIVAGNDEVDNIWKRDFRSLVRRWPIFVDDVMYLDAGDIYALNPETGDIYWQYILSGKDYYPYNNCLISKVTYGNDLIYTIKSDATLVGLEPHVGDEVGSLSVSPPPAYRNASGDQNGPCNIVVASDKFLAVYYSDSDEVIVFEQETQVGDENENK